MTERVTVNVEVRDGIPMTCKCGVQHTHICKLCGRARSCCRPECISLRVFDVCTGPCGPIEGAVTNRAYGLDPAMRPRTR